MSASFDMPHTSSQMVRVEDDTECEECSETFSGSRQLYRHLFDAHAYSKMQLNHLKLKRRNINTKKKASLASKEIYCCEICDRPYMSKLGLSNHKERQHGQEKRRFHTIDNIGCPLEGCTMRFQTYFDLAVHCDLTHRDMVNDQDAYVIVRAKFTSFDKFTQWKEQQEMETDSRFYVRSTETKIRYGKKVWLLKCNDTNRKRGPHVGPFSAEHCPAFIRICERFNGDVEAVACFGHAGHVHRTNTRAAVREIHLRHKRNVAGVDGILGMDEVSVGDLDGVSAKRRSLEDNIIYEDDFEEAQIRETGYSVENDMCYRHA